MSRRVAVKAHVSRGHRVKASTRLVKGNGMKKHRAQPATKAKPKPTASRGALPTGRPFRANTQEGKAFSGMTDSQLSAIAQGKRSPTGDKSRDRATAQSIISKRGKASKKAAASRPSMAEVFAQQAAHRKKVAAARRKRKAGR